VVYNIYKYITKHQFYYDIKCYSAALSSDLIIKAHELNIELINLKLFSGRWFWICKCQ